MSYSVRPVIARSLLVGGALLLLFAQIANADGAYQRTKDGKTRVWNNHPEPGDAATWSGGRDAKGYATGYGTLTWYSTERKKVTGSNLPSAKYNVISLYSGTMVRGKLDGQVENVDSHGKIFHGAYVDGRKASGWTAGPAPAPSSTPGLALAEQTDASLKQETVSAPAEGPPSVQPARQSFATTKQPAQSFAAPSVTDRPSPTIDDSLRSLIGPSPAPLLETNAVAEPSPSVSTPPPAAPSPPPVTSTSSPPPAPPAASPHLSAAEVIELANAEAHREGYNPGEYQRPATEYVAAEEMWSVSYQQMYADGASKRFTVSVEDKTKKTSFTAGR